MNIVINGKAVSKIVLPKNPSECEAFAAKELALYIKKISGAEVKECKECAECDNLIIIGSPERNEYAKKVISLEKFKALVDGPEGFLIKSSENMLLIAGNDGDLHRGTLYGVYEFLERYLDVCLAAYGNSNVNMGEYIPKTDSIAFDDIEYVSPHSDLPYRCAIVQYDHWIGNPNHKLNEKFISYLAKNRYNRILTWAGIYEGYKKNGMLEEARKRGIMFTVGHHEASTLFLPAEGNAYFKEKYYQTHPEYYRLLPDGGRYYMKSDYFMGQLVFCMRNQDCIKQISENIIAWSKQNPYVDTISLWPNDCADDQCCCEECSKYSKSENYTYFVNRIAELVTKEVKNMKFDRIVYADLLDCGEEKIHSSVVIDEAVWHSSGLRKVGNPDGSGYANTNYEEILLRFKEKGAEVVYYDYLMGIYDGKQKILPAADEMQAICKRFVEKKISGLGTQMDVYNHWNNTFNFYVYGRTAYNTSLTMQDNLSSFLRLFGGGGKYIKLIIENYEKIVDGQETIMKAQEYLINNIDKNKIYELFEKAFESAENELFRNNIRMMRMAFRYSDLEVNSPKILEGKQGHISNACDENGELWYMSKNFNSYLSEKEGFAIALPIRETDKKFIPNKWYIFE